MKKLDKTDPEYMKNRMIAMINRREDSGLDTMLAWMENAFRSQWSLPSELVGEEIKWIHRVTSTDPHDAIRAMTRTLSTVMPKVTLYPLMNNEDSRKQANTVERILEWQFQQASERRTTSLLADIVLSAGLYDEVIIGVWYLDEQIRYLESLGLDARREKMARRYGHFINKVYSPRDAIVEYSDLMPERVLFKEVLPVTEVIDYWGDHADEVWELSESREYKDHNYCTIYDLNEIGYRGVFAQFQKSEVGYSAMTPEGAVKIIAEETPYDFLPIAAKIGGTSLAKEESFKRIPLLWSVYNSGQWETQNILETLLASEGLAYAVSPRYAVESERAVENVDMDFRDPARIVMLKPGQKLQDLRPPQLNQGLEVLAERVGARMSKSTVPRVLQSSDYMDADAFASLNLVTQSGIKSITPYKKLAESALAEAFTIMLEWIHHANKPLQAYIPTKLRTKTEMAGLPVTNDSAELLEIDPQDAYDVENIYIKVTLTEDVPTDFMAKLNSASILVTQLRVSYAQALEWAGFNDPEMLLELREAEETKFAEANSEIQRIMNETSLDMMQKQQQLDQLIQQLQQMMAEVQQMMAQAQQGQAGPNGAAPGGPMGGPGMPGGPGGGQIPMGETVAPDGSMPPDMQRLAAARRGNDRTSPFPGLNPAQGDVSPHQAAPGIGLREEKQMLEGEG